MKIREWRDWFIPSPLFVLSYSKIDTTFNLKSVNHKFQGQEFINSFFIENEYCHLTLWFHRFRSIYKLLQGHMSRHMLPRA